MAVIQIQRQHSPLGAPPNVTALPRSLKTQILRKIQKDNLRYSQNIAYLAWTSGKWNILMKIGGDGGDDGDGIHPKYLRRFYL